MSVPQAKLLKSVDSVPKRVTIPLTDDREFWIGLRHARLMELAVIEKKLGIIRRRCRYCQSNNVIHGEVEHQG